MVPDLDCAFVAAAILANADALRVLPVGTKGRGAAGAYPLVAAFVALLLFFQALLQGLHQFVPAELFNAGPFFRAELQFQVFAQPLQWQFAGEVGEQFYALEIGSKSPVKAVVMLFVLDQCGAAQVVEVIDLVAVAVLFCCC